MESPTTLRDLLRAYRRSMGWTQEALASHWNYSFETISAWERGKRHPSNQEIPRLANLLGMPAEELALCLRSNHARSGSSPQGGELPDRIVQEWGTAYETWGELRHIYRNRTEFNRHFSYSRMLEDAVKVIAVGISLNAVALNYGREQIVRSITEHGATYQLCFLNPDGAHCRQREIEEGLEEGTIAELTRINLRHMQFIKRQLLHLGSRYAERLQLSTFDLPPRYNIYIVDDATMTAQTYGYGRGEDTPTLVLRRQQGAGLFEFYATAARYTLEHATPVQAEELVRLEEARG